jgi:hypothetical protein
MGNMNRIFGFRRGIPMGPPLLRYILPGFHITSTFNEENPLFITFLSKEGVK